MSGLSLVAVTGVYSLVAVHRLLIAVASLGAEQWLEGTWVSEVVARGLSRWRHTGSLVVVYRLSCSKVCGILVP